MSINSRNGSTLLEGGFFAPCRVATTAAITLAGLITIDGVTLIDADRVLVKNQVDQTTNGIYAASSGNWVRAADAASNSQFFLGMAVNVSQGIVNAGLTYLCTATDDPVVVGTSIITFASQTGVASALVTATSTTSAALTTGAKTFTTQSGKNFAANQWLLIQETANQNNNLLAQVTSYSGTSLVVNVVATAGSGGPFTDWTIVLTNTPAAAGRQPPIGTGNVTGPGSAVSHNLPRFADTTGKLIEDSGTAAGTLAGRNTLQFGDAGAKSISAAALADGAAPLPFVAAMPSDNLTLSNDGTNPNTDIQITAGRCRDLADTTNLQLAATMLKRLDIAWAAGGNVGNRQGALDTGSSNLASKTYHVYLIGRLALSVTSWSRSSNVVTLVITGHALGVGGTIRCAGIAAGVDGVYAISASADSSHVSFANTGADVGATTVAGTADGFDILASQQDVNGYPSPSLPSGWTVKQALGSILTDGSKNIRPFVQFGDYFQYKTSLADFTQVNSGSGNIPLTLPVGVSVLAEIAAQLVLSSGLATTNCRFTPTDSTAEVASSSNCDIQLTQGQDTAGNNQISQAAVVLWIRTDTSANIALSTSNRSGNATLTMRTYGWRDPRRRLF